MNKLNIRNNLKKRKRSMIAIFMIFIMLGSVLFTAVNVAALAMTDITAVADENTKAGLPLTTVEFSLTYTNNNQVDSAKLRNWKLEPNFGASTGTNWNSTLVNADENMTIPPNGGQRQINVIARIGKYAEETLLQQLKISVDVYDSSSKIGTKQKIIFVDVEQTYELSMINKTGDPDTKPRSPSGKAIFKFTVNNLGNGQDTISFSTSGPFQDITFSGDSRSMDPFSFSNYTMTINNIPEDLTKGTHTTVVNSQSKNTTLSPSQHPFDVEIPAQYDLTLQLNETKANKEVIPGESNTFNFTLINEGNTKDYITVTTGFKASAPEWSLLMNSENDFNLDKDKMKNIQIEVSAPTDQNYPFSVPIFVNCSSKNNVSVYKNSTVNAKIKQISKIKLDMPLVKTLNLNTFTASFKINVSNEGNGVDTINFEPISTSLFPSGEIWSYEFTYKGASISSITIPSNEFRDVYLNFTSPENPKKGSFILYVNASSDNDPSEKASNEITISVKDRFNIELISKSGLQHSAYPGDIIPIVIQGKNIGNVEGTFNLNIKKPDNAADWETPVFEPPVFLTMPIDDISNSYLNITVDNDAQKGFYLFVVNATKSGGATEEYDSFILNISVKRKYEVKLSVDSPTLKTDPGTSANFKFIVQNKGTGSCNLTMEATMDAIPETYMNVKITPSSFELPTATSTQIVWVNITPSDESPLAPMNITGVPITINADITEKLGNPDNFKEIKVQINQSYGIDTYVSELYKNIEPGTTGWVMITVTNDGNGEDSFGIFPNPPPSRPSWNVKANPTSTGLMAQGENRDINITISIPSTEAVISDNITINITSIGVGDGSIWEIKKVRIIVEETKDFKFINTDSRKEVEPGSFVHFTIELENTGTIDDIFSLDIVGGTAEYIDYVLAPTLNIKAKKRNSTILNISVSDEDIDKLPNMDNITVEASNSDDTVILTRTFTIDITEVRGVRLSTSPLEQKGKPKETLIFNISIENSGTGKDKFALSILPNPPYTEWAILKNIGDFTELLDPLETSYATVEVEIPAKRSPSPPYGKITILAESKENPEKNDTLVLTINVEQVFKLVVTPEPKKRTVDPGNNATYQIRVKNDGTGQDTIALDYEITEDSESISYVEFSEEDLVLNPGETKTVTFTVVTLDEVEAGKLTPKIKITAESQNDTDDNPASDFDELVVEINPTVDIELQADKIKQDVTPNLRGTKAEIIYTVIIYNRGLDGDTFDITETNNHGYIVELSPSTTSKIEPDKSQDISVKIIVDNNAPMSVLDYNTTLEVTSRTNKDKSETITLKMRIKQTYGMELQVKDETLDTEDIISGNNRIVTFMVDIQNIGTGDDTCKLEVISGDYSTWATLSNSYFTLDSGDNESFTVRVKVPRDTAVDDYNIKIKAVSRGDDDLYETTDAFDEATLTVSVTQFYEIKLEAVDIIKTGEPGDSIDFTITVINRGNARDTVELARRNYNTNWIWTLSQKSFSLEPIDDPNEDDQRDIKLSVTIPRDRHGKEGLYNISIFVYSTNTPDGKITQNNGEPLILTVDVDPIYEVDLILESPTSTDDQKALPGKRINYRVTIKNRGNTLDTFTLSFTGTKSGWVDSQENTVSIGPYRSQQVNFTIEIPSLTDVNDAEDIEAKKYQVRLKATSEGDNEEYDELLLNPTVQSKYELDLVGDLTLDSQNRGTITVNPNADPDYESFTLTIYNRGNTRDDISLKTKGISDWTVRFKFTGTSTLSLDIGRSEVVTVEITAPSDAENGDYKVITIESESKNGKITATYTIYATVETAKIVFKTLKIDGDTSVGSKPTFTLTVANEGDVDAEDVEIKFYDRSQNNKLIHTEKIDKLSKNDQIDVQFTYTIEEGEHKIEATTSWSDKTIKKSQTFSSEVELLSGDMFWIILVIVAIVVFFLALGLASANYRRGIPPELREEIAMAKKGKPFSEIEQRRQVRNEKFAPEKKKGALKGDDLEEREKPGKKGLGKMIKIKCPKCDKVQNVTSTKRPIEFPCSNCGMKLVLKK